MYSTAAPVPILVLFIDPLLLQSVCAVYSQWRVQGRVALCLACILPSVGTSQPHRHDGNCCKRTTRPAMALRQLSPTHTHIHRRRVDTHPVSSPLKDAHLCSLARTQQYIPAVIAASACATRACLTPARLHPSAYSRLRRRPRALESLVVAVLCATDELLNKSSAGRPRRPNLACTPSLARYGRPILEPAQNRTGLEVEEIQRRE